MLVVVKLIARYALGTKVRWREAEFVLFGRETVSSNLARACIGPIFFFAFVADAFWLIKREPVAGTNYGVCTIIQINLKTNSPKVLMNLTIDSVFIQ